MIDKVIGAIKAIIKTILQLKDMLLNVLRKAASVIGQIIAHPIAFLGNLVDAVKLGLSNFMGRLGEHLERGLLSWLFGELSDAGIELPQQFDLKGILSLVLQVLGLTYKNIRSRAVKLVGEKVVSGLEQAAGVLKILLTEGPAGLWEFIKERLADLKTVVWEGIKSFIMERIIVAGITWVLSLLNPVAAFIKACKAIYSIVMFFVERARQILEFINAILDSLGAIASGAIGAAAKAVEDALAKAIPLVIAFLASLLGLGGIGAKVKEIIERLRAPVNAAIDWVIGKAVSVVKSAGRLFGIGKEKETEEKPEEKPPSTGDPEHDTKLNAGLLAIDAEEEQYLESGGTITREHAENVAAKVKKEHPVFQKLQVVEGKESWDYDYTASPGATKKGEKKAGSPQETLLNLVGGKKEVPDFNDVDGLGRAKGPKGHAPKDKLGGDRESLPARSGLPGAEYGAYQAGDHRGHLIGDRFGGEATAGNLVPMHSDLNLSTFKSYENQVANKYEEVRKANKAGLIYMHIKPHYPGNQKTVGASYRPETVTFKAEVITLENGKLKPEAFGPKDLDNPKSGQERVVININEAKRAELATLPGIDAALADKIVVERRKKEFFFYEDLAKRVPGLDVNELQTGDPFRKPRLRSEE